MSTTNFISQGPPLAEGFPRLRCIARDPSATYVISQRMRDLAHQPIDVADSIVHGEKKTVALADDDFLPPVVR